MKRILISVIGGVALAGLAACSRNVTVSVQAPTGLPKASASSAPALSYTVSCQMAKGPINSFSGNPSFIPRVTVKNTGSSTLHIPDLAVNDSPLSFSVEFFNASGTQVNEDDGFTPNQNGATIQPRGSFTFTPLQMNGVVNDDQAGNNVTSCTASFDGGL
jgi:hypothetical protein